MAKMDSRNKSTEGNYLDELVAISQREREAEATRQQGLELERERGYQGRKTAREAAEVGTEETLRKAAGEQKLALSPEAMAAKLQLAEAGLNRTPDGQVVNRLLRAGMVEEAMRFINDLKNDATKQQIKSNADVIAATLGAQGRVGAAQVGAQGGVNRAVIQALGNALTKGLGVGLDNPAIQKIMADFQGSLQTSGSMNTVGSPETGAGIAQSAGLGPETMPQLFPPRSVFGGRVPTQEVTVGRGTQADPFRGVNQQVANFDPLAAMGRAPGAPTGAPNPALFGPAMAAGAPQGAGAGAPFGNPGEWQQFMANLAASSMPKPQTQMTPRPPQTPGQLMGPRPAAPAAPQGQPPMTFAPSPEGPQMNNLTDWMRKYAPGFTGGTTGQSFKPGGEVFSGPGMESLPTTEFSPLDLQILRMIMQQQGGMGGGATTALSGIRG